MFPVDKYKTDLEFQNNCFIFMLFHGQNRVSAADGVNHWIPFTEKEVNAKEKFESNFMSNFLKSPRITQIGANISDNSRSLADPFSKEAQTVLATGLELWKYYHTKIKNNTIVSVNASFYDIREFFQGRNANGTMNVTSADETYNTLIKNLRKALKTLSQKIEPKVYEYGFLRE